MTKAQAGLPYIPVAQLPHAGLHPFTYNHQLFEPQQEPISLPLSLEQEVWGDLQGSSTVMTVGFKKGR